MKNNPNIGYIFLAVCPLACASTGDIATYILIAVSYLIAFVVVIFVFLLCAAYCFWQKYWLLKIAKGIALPGAVLSLIFFCLSFIPAYDHSTAITTGFMFLICIGTNCVIKLVELKVNKA